MLRANNLFKKYQNKNVIKNITLNITDNRIIGILGPNGCGKSTLINLLNGSLLPDSGSVLLHRQNLKEMASKKKSQSLATLNQELIFSSYFTVEKFVLMGRYPHLGRFSSFSNEDNRIADESLHITNSLSLKEKELSALSGGEKQRVAIAKILAQKPQILFLDEPTTYLDIKHQLLILNLLKMYQKQHEISIVMVLHDINLASQFCDELLFLKEGFKFKFGKPSDVINHETIEEVYDVRPIIINHPVYKVPQILL